MVREVTKNKILTLNSAVDPESIRAASELNRKCPWILTAAGIHPWKAGIYGPETVESLEEEYRSSLQISEIGIDMIWAPPEAGMERQKLLLEAQLSMAVRHNKPVTIHTKGAEKDVLEILKPNRPTSVLIHWFDGSQSQLKSYLDLGCFFTVSPAVFKDSKFRSLVKQIPLEYLLPETDNPGTWPWLFNKEGHPLQISHVMQETASFLNLDVDDLLLQFKSNLQSFLQL